MTHYRRKFLYRTDYCYETITSGSSTWTDSISWGPLNTDVNNNCYWIECHYIPEPESFKKKLSQGPKVKPQISCILPKSQITQKPYYNRRMMKHNPRDYE